MVCLLIRINGSESEVYWKLGDPPVINAERVVGIQADDKELEFIVKITSYQFKFDNICSWFGIDAKKISILIGAAR